MPTVGFLHTSPVHVSTFRALVAELAPGTTVIDVVDDELLETARRGDVTDQRVVAGIERRLEELTEGGAELVLCTCSTIGGIAESIGRHQAVRVVRVDRPMAERAVDIGGRIVVIATLASTLDPTRELLESVATDRDAELDLALHVVNDGWASFEAGDHDGYLGAIAEALTLVADRCDVIVLAQASMAEAADLVDVGVPVLSSPRTAVSTLLA